MASVNILLTNVCSGGEHFELQVSLDGGATKTFSGSVGDFNRPITDENFPDVFNVLLRLFARGKTLAQIKTALQAGVTLTVE